VYDFGEPRAIGAALNDENQAFIDQVYIDGAIPDFIRILYEVDKTVMADELAIEYLKQLETMMNYFQHSDALIAYNNKKDFISFGMNFLKTYANVYVSSPESDAAKLAHELDQKMTQKVVNGIVEGLRSHEIKETIRGGRTQNRRMEKEALEFAKLYNAMLRENGFQSEGEAQGQQ
jgi:hypothetical protein